MMCGGFINANLEGPYLPSLMSLEVFHIATLFAKKLWPHLGGMAIGVIIMIMIVVTKEIETNAEGGTFSAW